MSTELEKIKKTLRNLAQEVKEKYKAEIIGIFGSYVRGEQKKGSDVDILVRFERGATLIHFVGLSIFLEEKLNMKVDVVPYDRVREEIRGQILKETIYI